MQDTIENPYMTFIAKNEDATPSEVAYAYFADFLELLGVEKAVKAAEVLMKAETRYRRGRPATGSALTPAQKQKAYRERLKSNVTKNVQGDGQINFLRKLLDKERENTERLANKVLELERQIKELKKGNVTGTEEKPVKGWDLEYWAAGKWNTLGMPSSTKKKAVERVERFNKSDSEKGLWRLKVKNGAASGL